jgi:hypothetical protein
MVMSYKVLFKKRIIDKDWYDLGSYATYDIAMVVAKGEYYYRGGVTPEYEIVECNKLPQEIPPYLYPTLIYCAGFLSSEEQEAFRNEHFKYLRTKGLV